MRQAAGEDRVWKNFCHERWRRVNIRVESSRRGASRGGGGEGGGHQAIYASLNGWRDPRRRLRRTILSTAPGSAAVAQRVTRAAQAAAGGGGHATNISGMDVSPSRVVLCSADTAWYYHVPHASDTPQQDVRERREHQSESQSHQRRVHPSRDKATSPGRREGRLDVAGFTGEAPSNAAVTAAVSPESALRGVRLPSSCVTEARFSGDEERCFFGSMSGEVYVHEFGVGVGGARHSPGATAGWSRLLALTSPGGTQVAVRQVVSTFDGGCSRGSRLGVLCRPPSGWQPNPEGSGGGYLFLVDSVAQEVARWMKLGDGRLGGLKFPSAARGGAAVSTAPLSSEGTPFGSGGGELFAVGFRGGSLALYDGRCQAAGGLVAGFVSSHRWLERVRSAGPLLMASYGRNTSIETWDIRRLPICPTHEDRPAPLRLHATPAPPRLHNLTCAANSPDFWVEPHGLCVAVYGAPRHSQRFGAKHAFWPWPKPDLTLNGGRIDADENVTEVGGNSRDVSMWGQRVGGGTGGARAAEGGEGKGSGICRVEVPVPGVVSDSDYRLCLSTGVKFTDTHLATVLDSSRVLVNEMTGMVEEPTDGVEGVRTMLLSS
eukprot:g7909.t1